jgi:hypothetical protein
MNLFHTNSLSSNPAKTSSPLAGGHNSEGSNSLRTKIRHLVNSIEKNTNINNKKK